MIVLAFWYLKNSFYKLITDPCQEGKELKSEIMPLHGSYFFFLVRRSNQQNHQFHIPVLKGVIKDAILYMQHFLINVIPSGPYRIGNHKQIAYQLLPHTVW